MNKEGGRAEGRREEEEGGRRQGEGGSKGGRQERDGSWKVAIRNPFTGLLLV